MPDPAARPQPGGGPGRVARRAVTGGAWTLPVILVAAPVPAVAASPLTEIVFNGFDVFQGGANPQGLPNAVAANLSLRNTGLPTPATITTLTVRVRYPRNRLRQDPSTVTGTGWTFAGTTRFGTQQEYVFTWTGTLVAFASTPLLQFTIPLQQAGRGFVITATATAAGPATTTATASDTYTT